jgi:glycosyltransferase involved in cell wall biosynthesis
METNQKILILLFYYNRPEIVKNALNSIVRSEYTNYEVAFINDSGDDSSNHILDFLKDHESYNKFKQYNIKQSINDKKLQGGSIFGKVANQAIMESESDIVFMLCDDDALADGYLSNLNTYYNTNPAIMWAYSKVKYYIPSHETYLHAQDNFTRIQHAGSIVDLNKHSSPINPDCKCDASQVSFRRKCFTEKDVWFSYPKTRNLDSDLYNKIYHAWGDCYPTGFYGQCKGVFSDQLGCRQTDDFNVNIQ